MFLNLYSQPNWRIISSNKLNKSPGISSDEGGFSVLGLGLENLGTRYFMHKSIDYRIN
jgi:hypothetical protein